MSSKIAMASLILIGLSTGMPSWTMAENTCNLILMPMESRIACLEQKLIEIETDLRLKSVSSGDKGLLDKPEVQAAMVGAGLGFVLGGFGAIIGYWFQEWRMRKKQMLEELYSPLLGHLKVNEWIWKDFREKEVPEASNNPSPRQIVSALLDKPNTKDLNSGLNKWVAVIESSFRHNNEAAEMLLLRKWEFLTPQDRGDEKFLEVCKDFLVHVGEFKAVFRRWEAVRQNMGGNCDWDKYLREKYVTPECLDWRNQSPEVLYQEFHPKNDYPAKFWDRIETSHDQLSRRNWWSRLVQKLECKCAGRSNAPDDSKAGHSSNLTN